MSIPQPEGSADESLVPQDDAPIASTAPKPKDRPAIAFTPRPDTHIIVVEPLLRARDQIGLSKIVLAQEEPDDGSWDAKVAGCKGRDFRCAGAIFPLSRPS